MSKPIVMERGVKYRDADKMALIPVKNVATEREALLRKPEWMKIKLPADSSRIQGIKAAMRKNGLHSVCEEASCPNLAECFQPRYRDLYDPRRDLVLVAARSAMSRTGARLHQMRTNHRSWRKPSLIWVCATSWSLQWTVTTCVMAAHSILPTASAPFARKNPSIKIETLVPDFRGRMDRALDILTVTPPDVFNHNLGKRTSSLSSGAVRARITTGR